MTQEYNKPNSLKMQVETKHSRSVTEVPLRSGSGMLKEIQSPDTGALIFGASGEMGSKITSTFPKAHVHTTMQDIDKDKLDQSKAEAYSTLGKGVKVRKVPHRAWVKINTDGLLGETIAFPDKGKIPFSQINEALSRSPAEARQIVSKFLDTVLGTDTDTRRDYSNLMMVLEAGPEILPFKQNVFKFFELALSNPSAVLATNTSSLSVDDIAAKLEHPERAVGFHYFIPAHINPLIEVIAGSKTSPEVIDAMCDLAIAMNKKPIVCRKDRPGAIANRILVGVLNEAAKMSDQGIASPDFIDKVFLETFYPEQIHIKAKKAQTQFKEAPKLAKFKDEARIYQQIEECEAQRNDSDLMTKKPNLRNELLAKKLELLTEAFGELRQKALYAGIVENLSVLGSFFTPAESVPKIKQLAQGQLNIIGKYLLEVEKSPETLLKTVEEVTGSKLVAYEFPRPPKTENKPGARELIRDRLLGAYIAIAQEIIKEDLTSPGEVETACKEGFKYNYGPLELARKLGRDRVRYLTSLVNKGLDQSRPTGISKPGEFIELGKNDLSGVQVHIRDGVGFVTLGRLHMQQLQMMQNSLGPETLIALKDAVHELEAKGVKAICFKSNGGGPFSAGADLNYIASTKWNINKLIEYRNLGKEVMNTIANCKVPTVALVDGAAVGGGLELTLACDYRVFTDLAVIAMPEVALGIIPDWGGTERLPSIVGKELAKRLICTARLKNLGEKLGGEDCYRVGLADAFVTQAEFPHMITDLVDGKGPIDITKKPRPKLNHNRKTEEYPAHIVKRFELDQRYIPGRRWFTRFAELHALRLIDNSDVPGYAEQHNTDEVFKRLIGSGRNVSDYYIEPYITLVQSSVYPVLERTGELAMGLLKKLTGKGRK